MQRSAVLLGAALAALSLGACGSPSHVRLEPVRVDPDATCGFPGDAQLMLVTALGDGPSVVRNPDLDAPMDISDFPAWTRQIEVEIRGAGGVVRSLGRTAPLDLAGLADGAVIPILMAPPEDGCPVGGLSIPRDHPIVVATGDGALVVGGDGPSGPLGTAEWYDPGTGLFTPIETPSALQGPHGADGMSAALMPDGRVVLTGGDRPVFVIFHPDTRTFDNPPGALFPARAHHASVALDDDHVLVAGGCSDVECMPTSALFDSWILELSTGTLVPGPALVQDRIGGVALREPAVADADAVRVLLTGGLDAGGAPAPAERVDPAVMGGAAVGALIAGAGAVAAPLAAGSVLVGFAPEGAPADGAHAVLVPGVAAARVPMTDGPRAGPTLTALEDGGVLIVGGGAASPVARYHPASGAVTALTLAPAPDGLADALADRGGQGAARLPDGTVLIVGGHDAAGPLDGAAVFRPDGDSPFTGAVSVTPAGAETERLVPLDPVDVDASPAYVITGQSAALTRWVAIAGMRPRELALDATLIVSRGAGVLLGMVDAENLDAVELVVGAPARLFRRDAGVETERCVGAETVTAAELAPVDGADPLPVHVAVQVGGGKVSVRLGTRLVLDCALADARAGMVGVAALGSGETVTLSTISVTR